MATIRISAQDLADMRAAFKPLPMQETMLGRSIPKGWDAGHLDEKTWWYRNQALELFVMESVGNVYSDGKTWQHISVSRHDRLPDWPDLEMCKRVFMGHDVTALQVLPPVSRYVNIHQFCLHLWRCLDGDVTPDFSTVIDGVRHV